MKFGFKIMLTLLLSSIVLAGCGGPKADVPMFIMGDKGFPTAFIEKLESTLQQRLGAVPTIKLNGSAIFSMEKLVVELAAGGNGIMIISEDQFQGIAAQGGGIPLDSMFDPKDYPTGVVETLVDSQKPDGLKAKHLYGIPLSQTSWLKDTGYAGKELFAIIHPRAPNLEAAKQVLKVISAK
jgi:ABC-type glycerol-3-phosphate transport system substrate-binding protein